MRSAGQPTRFAQVLVRSNVIKSVPIAPIRKTFGYDTTRNNLIYTSRLVQSG